MTLESTLKYNIADSITTEGRSKTDVIQDVYDEFVEHGIIIEATKLSAKNDRDFLTQCLRTVREQPPSMFSYEGAADYILGGLQNYNEYSDQDKK